jgi:hypothetical protein
MPRVFTIERRKRLNWVLPAGTGRIRHCTTLHMLHAVHHANTSAASYDPHVAVSRGTLPLQPPLPTNPGNGGKGQLRGDRHNHVHAAQPAGGGTEHSKQVIQPDVGEGGEGTGGKVGRGGAARHDMHVR